MHLRGCGSCPVFERHVLAAICEIPSVELKRRDMNNDSGSRELMTWIEDLVVIFAIGYAIRWLLGL
jgi:hypothetical protein